MSSDGFFFAFALIMSAPAVCLLGTGSLHFRASLLAVLPVGPTSAPLVLLTLSDEIFSFEARGVEAQEATFASELVGVEAREPGFPSERGDEARELALLLERGDEPAEPALEALGLFKMEGLDVLLIRSTADPVCTFSFMPSPVPIGGGAEAEATTKKGISEEQVDAILPDWADGMLR